jgi:hypothetical protein
MNSKGFGSGRGLILSYYPGLYLEGQNITKSSGSIAGPRAKIWNRDPPSRKQECYHSTTTFGGLQKVAF